MVSRHSLRMMNDNLHKDERELTEIICKGGYPGVRPFDVATIGDVRLDRKPDETERDFRWRARAAAREAGADAIVFGGLPR